MQGLDTMGKIFGYLRLMRPVNCFMMGVAVIVGASLSSNLIEIPLHYLVLGFISGFSLTAASMTINDYYDREIDAVNEPNRPIPSGVIKPKEALIFASVLTIIGFAAASLTNITCFLIAIFAWLVFVLYTTVGKRSGLPGNFLVSTCVVIPFIYGSAISGIIQLNVLFFVSMVFLSNTGREITKGIVDVQGDKMRKVKTLAVTYGEKTAAIIAVLFYLLAVLLSPIPWILGIVSFWFIPLVTITDLGLIASSLMLLKNVSRENTRKVKNMILLWFIFGLLAFMFGVLVE
jgi:geranylgeranylglycerol-phosphate geranylgeranyltransferase